MLQRCYNSKDPDYKNYGHRGIWVCKKWKNNYWSFHKWCGLDFKKGLMLDRRQNSGPYSPENCRWVTPLVSTHNRRWTKARHEACKKIAHLAWSKTD